MSTCTHPSSDGLFHTPTRSTWRCTSCGALIVTPPAWGRKRFPKPRVEMLPAGSLLTCGQVVAAGADEHGDRWRTRSAAHHAGCALRHLLRWFAGEHTDDSGASHLAHAATRLLMAVDREELPS